MFYFFFCVFIKISDRDVKTVLLRGKIAIDDNECKLEKGYGQFIKRNKVNGMI